MAEVCVCVWVCLSLCCVLCRRRKTTRFWTNMSKVVHFKDSFWIFKADFFLELRFLTCFFISSYFFHLSKRNFVSIFYPNMAKFVFISWNFIRNSHSDFWYPNPRYVWMYFRINIKIIHIRGCTLSKAVAPTKIKVIFERFLFQNIKPKLSWLSAVRPVYIVPQTLDSFAQIFVLNFKMMQIQGSY